MIQKRIPKIRRMAPTTAVWNSRMPGLFVNPLYQAVPDAYLHDTHPVGTDSHLDFSGIKGNQDLSTAFCRSEQRRAPAARPNTKYRAARRLNLKFPRREPRLQDRAALKTSHQGPSRCHSSNATITCMRWSESTIRDGVVATATEFGGSSAACDIV